MLEATGYVKEKIKVTPKVAIVLGSGLGELANMVEDADAFSGATIRAPKVISAIWDALNRHAYRVE